MLYNGEQHRRRLDARGRHRGRPDRRHHAHGAGPRQRDRRHRGQRAGHDVRPRARRLHGEDRRRARGAPASIDITATRHARTSSWSPRRSGRAVRDLTAVILDRPRHADIIDEVRASGARIRLIRTATSPARSPRAWPDAGADVLFGIGGTPEGVIAAGGAQVHGRRDPGPLSPADDDERAAMLAAGYDLDARAHHRRPRAAATTASSPPPASPTASCCQGVRYEADGAQHAEPRDALASRAPSA